MVKLVAIGNRFMKDDAIAIKNCRNAGRPADPTGCPCNRW